MNVQAIGIVLMIVGSLTTFASGISLLVEPGHNFKDEGRDRRLRASRRLNVQPDGED